MDVDGRYCVLMSTPAHPPADLRSDVPTDALAGLPLQVPQASPLARVMGSETEYGISVVGEPGANPMVSSSLIVNAYASLARHSRQARWDFEQENPLRDARGFDLSREVADPSQLTDEQTAMVNVILDNGARLYVDHAHPEYSGPEVTNPLAAVLWDKAGEHIMAQAAAQAALQPPHTRINLYKNNTDNKGASYGNHENYLMSRRTEFADIVRLITPFFVTRQVFAGAGRVGIGQDGRGTGFQISQRADYFEVEVGLETTLKRPIVNTRDEPHADAEKYRRLHVIIGDANLSEISTYLKMGTTSLLLAMIEQGWLDAHAPDLRLHNPVQTLHEISHDPSLQYKVSLANGQRMSAVHLQMLYAEQARAFVNQRMDGQVDAQTADVLDRWEQVLGDLEADPMRLADQLDWVAKLKLLQGYRDRDGLEWDHPRLGLVDLQYSDVRPDKGLYNRLVAGGRMQRLVTDAQVQHAVACPPEDTRAWFRGQCLIRFADNVAAASWDSVIFDIPGSSTLQRVPMREPLRGTKVHVQQLFARCTNADELVQALTGQTRS